MAQLNKPNQQFDTLLWTGNGSSVRNVSGLDFSPGAIWAKSRSTAGNHYLVDRSRGGQKMLSTNAYASEDAHTAGGGISGFDANGFTCVGISPNTNDNINANNVNFVSWNWNIPSSGSSNNNGDINSIVRVNNDIGMSVVTYTGNGGSAGQTVGHGLSKKPKVIILADRVGGSSIYYYHESASANERAVFQTTDSFSTQATPWNSTEPTNTVVSLKDNLYVNGNNRTYVMWCFTEVSGFSQFAFYDGNSASAGRFVYTGFEPAMLLIKRQNQTADWLIFDNKRFQSYSAKPDIALFPNSNTLESNFNSVEFHSNGFTLATSNGYVNNYNNEYTYMCFASKGLVGTNGVPNTGN